MDINAIFSNLNTLWTRWSAYEVTDNHGIAYLTPAPGAEAFQYNCAEQPETLVAEALELGRQIERQSPDVDRACAAFAAHHGLLGLGGDTDAGLFSTGAVAPCYRPVGERDYGEAMERFKAELAGLYRHFLAGRGQAPAVNLPAMTGGLSFKLTAGQSPQLIWTADSLLDILRLTYAALITAPSESLKICRNCGMVYYNPHTKSEFCGTKCRNVYNVRAFREKGKRNGC